MSNRKEQPPQKLNEQREKEKLGMGKHKHPSVGTSIYSTMDASKVYNLSPQVKHKHVIQGMRIPTSSHYQTNIPLTNVVLNEKDMEILEDVNQYTKEDTRKINFVQYFHKDSPIAKINENNQSFIILTTTMSISLPIFTIGLMKWYNLLDNFCNVMVTCPRILLPYLIYLVHKDELLDVFMWMKVFQHPSKVNCLNELFIVSETKLLNIFFNLKVMHPNVRYL